MAGKAIGYSDYYKKNDVVPGDSSDDAPLDTKDITVEDAAKKRRKEALKRRLIIRKAGN